MDNGVRICYHCGNRTIMKEVGRYKHTTKIPYEHYFRLSHPGFIEFHKIYVMYFCPACEEVTIEKKIANSETTDEHGAMIWEQTIKYPEIYVDGDFIPNSVKLAFEAALRVKKVDTTLCVIGLRRTLEMMCNERDAEGKNLFSKLDDLHQKGTIPQILKDFASLLREEGNAAAHDDQPLSFEEVEELIDFTRTILDYVYKLPTKIEYAQKRIIELQTR